MNARSATKPLAWFAPLLLSLFPMITSAADAALAKQREALFEQLKQEQGLSDSQLQAIHTIFERSAVIGQGNPGLTVHPQTAQQCQDQLKRNAVSYANPKFELICHGKYMAPLYDPATQKPEDAKVCVDQFEFPNIPCAYPVVWVRAKEAAEICEAEGKRLCDAHEWEGACAGSLQAPDYDFDLARGVSPDVGLGRMRAAHNRADATHKVWSYGPTYKTGICGTGSRKTPGCPGGNWKLCGSNTYPAGDFPACRSKLEVYDLNGNAAEHMNLPLNDAQMASRGSTELGYTEMKGSWFVFDSIRAHDDSCRWRAPFWHGTRVMATDSHANYHLGFRCCKDP